MRRRGVPDRPARGGEEYVASRGTAVFSGQRSNHAQAGARSSWAGGRSQRGRCRTIRSVTKERTPEAPARRQGGGRSALMRHLYETTTTTNQRGVRSGPGNAEKPGWCYRRASRTGQRLVCRLPTEALRGEHQPSSAPAAMAHITSQRPLAESEADLLVLLATDRPQNVTLSARPSSRAASSVPDATAPRRL